MSTETCPRCQGRMFLDSFKQSCDDCQKSGASVCGNCWVHFEWNCMSCGYVKHLPRVRRKNTSLT